MTSTSDSSTTPSGRPRMQSNATWLSVLTAAFLTAAVALSIVFSVIGPERVEQQSIDLFQNEQKVIAEQGARRISENLRNLQVRFETEIQHLRETLRWSAPNDELQEVLEDLYHTRDKELGITLLVLNSRGRILASQPRESVDGKFQPRALQSGPDSPPFLYCASCLGAGAAISFSQSLPGPRTLTANIDLETFVRSVFQTVIRQTSSHAALVGPEGRTLYQTGVEPGPSANEPYVTATSPVPGTNWHVRVAAPRAAIAPEVGSTVTTLLVVNYAILAVLLVGLGLFAYLQWREYSNRLERLRQMAQQNKLATLGMMAASTSHEINNALSAAQFQIELAQQKVDQEDEIQERLDTVTSSVNRLGDLAKNLSNYASQGDTSFHHFPLRSSLEDALEVVRPKLGSYTQLDVEVKAKPTVHGAPDALTQVFVNLVLNALEEVEERSDGWIAVHLDRQQDTAILKIIDNGAGIPAEIIGDIFEPFVTTKSEQGGTGIGLWLSSRIVEQHGGSIHAHNIDNGGAQFTVKLPVAGDGDDPDTQPKAPEPSEDGPADDASSSSGT